MSVRIGVIVSSTRPTRSGLNVANWFMDQVKNNNELEFEIVDLKTIDLPFLSEPELPSSQKYSQQSTKAWSSLVAGFDGFVFITAEYNNAPPAPLKNAIDTLYVEWQKKPVAFVGYGGYGAARAIEQLVNITAKIGMVPLPEKVVGILDPWDSVTSEGVKAEFVHGHVDGLVQNLAWWTKLLKPARTV